MPNYPLSDEEILYRDATEGFAGPGVMPDYHWTPDAFFFGRQDPEFHDTPEHEIGIKDDRGIFIAAGSRGGKGTSLLVNNLITWPGPVFAIDPKGELASITAIRRGTAKKALRTGTTVRNFIGQDVVVLDPCGEVKGPGRVYRQACNPLADLDPDSENFTGEVESIAEGLVVPEQGNGSHFAESAETLIAGAIEAALVRLTPKHHNLVEVARLLRSPKLPEILAKTRRPLADEALAVLMKVGDPEGGGFFTTLSRQLKWLNDPRMAHHLSGNSVSLKKAVQSGASIYVVLPPKEMHKKRRWMRMILNASLRYQMDAHSVYNLGRRQTLFLVDEMPTLGAFREIEEGAGYLSGYGIKLVSVCQNLGQLKKLYPQNWETFIGNTCAIASFSLNEDGTSSYISRRLGKHAFIDHSSSESHSTGGSERDAEGAASQPGEKSTISHNTGKNWSTRRALEEILRPEQVQLTTSRKSGRMIVLPADEKPWRLLRVDYQNRLPRRYYDHPDDIDRFERRNRGT